MSLLLPLLSIGWRWVAWLRGCARSSLVALLVARGWWLALKRDRGCNCSQRKEKRKFRKIAKICRNLYSATLIHPRNQPQRQSFTSFASLHHPPKLATFHQCSRRNEVSSPSSRVISLLGLSPACQQLCHSISTLLCRSYPCARGLLVEPWLVGRLSGRFVLQRSGVKVQRWLTCYSCTLWTTTRTYAQERIYT
jgi:hypothetical protein